MKNLLTLLILSSFFYSNAQKSFFKPTLNRTNELSRVVPFSLTNNEINKQFVAENNIRIVYESQKIIIINTELGSMKSAEEAGKVQGLYQDLSVPQVMSDSAVVRHKADQVHAGFCRSRHLVYR